MKNTWKQFIIYVLTSVGGMIISHYIPHSFFWGWVALSLFVGHWINLKVYYRDPAKLDPSLSPCCQAPINYPPTLIDSAHCSNCFKDLPNNQTMAEILTKKPIR